MQFVLICRGNRIVKHLVCPSCNAEEDFKIIDELERTVVDLYFPASWDPFNLNGVVLCFVQIIILVVQCPCCGGKFRLVPSFMVEGTILTLKAIMLVAYFYESLQYTWRSLTSEIAKKTNLAHSTLYRAVHALGYSIEMHEALEHLKILHEEYFPADKEVEDSWPPAKSLFKHTRRRELNVRRVLTNYLLKIAQRIKDTHELLIDLAESLVTIFKNNGVQMRQLYCRVN